MKEVICGFEWADDSLHECISTEDHDEQNPCHVCDCGESIDCRDAAREREAKEYADAQVDYYAPGGFFDAIFDGAFRG